MLRKVNDKIYLSIFNLEYMKWLDEHMYYEIFNGEDQPYLTNLFNYPDEDVFDFFYIKIDSSGEAYLTLDTREIDEHGTNKRPKFFRYDLSADVVKSIFKTHTAILNSLTVFNRNDTGLDRDCITTQTLTTTRREFISNNVKKLQALINVWEGTASKSDFKLVGQQLNPFELGRYNFVEAWSNYVKYFNDPDDIDGTLSITEIIDIFEKTLK